MLRCFALAITLVVAPPSAPASEPRRSLMPEVCESEQRPALTSLAVPEPVQVSAHRAELVELAQRRRRSRRSAMRRWVLLVTVAAVAASAVALAESR